jgi:serine/threonine protein kinase
LRRNLGVKTQFIFNILTNLIHGTRTANWPFRNIERARQGRAGGGVSCIRPAARPAGCHQDIAHLGYKTEQLTREARIVSKFQHPNIITLYDSGEYQGTPYLVYAYVEGKTLAQLLKQEKTLPLTRAAEIACGVLEGLAYSHSQGVSHLDIKPTNVMITNNGIPMVMDFGLAKASNDQQPHDPTLSGTPRYVAPELVFGQIGNILDTILLNNALRDGNRSVCRSRPERIRGVESCRARENRRAIVSKRTRR